MGKFTKSFEEDIALVKSKEFISYLKKSGQGEWVQRQNGLGDSLSWLRYLSELRKFFREPIDLRFVLSEDSLTDRIISAGFESEPYFMRFVKQGGYEIDLEDIKPIVILNEGLESISIESKADAFYCTYYLLPDLSQHFNETLSLHLRFDFGIQQRDVFLRVNISKAEEKVNKQTMRLQDLLIASMKSDKREAEGMFVSPEFSSWAMGKYPKEYAFTAQTPGNKAEVFVNMLGWSRKNASALPNKDLGARRQPKEKTIKEKILLYPIRKKYYSKNLIEGARVLGQNRSNCGVGFDLSQWKKRGVPFRRTKKIRGETIIELKTTFHSYVFQFYPQKWYKRSLDKCILDPNAPVAQKIIRRGVFVFTFVAIIFGFFLYTMQTHYMLFGKSVSLSQLAPYDTLMQKLQVSLELPIANRYLQEIDKSIAEYNNAQQEYYLIQKKLAYKDHLQELAAAIVKEVKSRLTENSAASEKRTNIFAEKNQIFIETNITDNDELTTLYALVSDTVWNIINTDTVMSGCNVHIEDSVTFFVNRDIDAGIVSSLNELSRAFGTNAYSLQMFKKTEDWWTTRCCLKLQLINQDI